jgi:hypothetical protein
LKDHTEHCKTHAPVKTILADKPVEFTHFNCSMRVPFVIYVDFDTFNKKIDTYEPNPEQSYTQKIMKQVPSSFCFYLVSTSTGASLARASPANSSVTSGGAHAASGEKFEPVTYTASGDEDVAEIFVEKLTEYSKLIYNKFQKYPKTKIFTNDAVYKFCEAKVCHICEQPFTSKEFFPEEKNWLKVWDHYHLTDLLRGACHFKCNRQYRLPRRYSIVQHNLAGFDAHLFIKKLDGKIACTMNTDERYISFSQVVFMEPKYNKDSKEYAVDRELRFVDSFKFMASSLSSLLKSVKEFPHLRHIYQGEQLELLLTKGVYPYEWVDSPERFDETQLPHKEAFRSKLSGEDITDEDYEHI